MDHQNAAMALMREVKEACPSHAVEAIGHRVVHGGPHHGESVIVDDRVRDEILRLAELAPLHNLPAVAAMDATTKVLPGVPQVAVFDTAFYRKLPPVAVVYPLPYAWYAEWGYSRFGFHGISHSHCAARAAEIVGQSPEELRVVSLHLGNGCSATAVRGGQAIETTMGYTPMDGLMMGSRTGSIDPGLLLHAMKHRGLSADQVDNILNQESGLKGVSGISSDYRKVAAAAREGHERSGLALEIYARRVRSAVGALSATLGGLDALVFTAGVGENQPSLRAEVCGGLEFLGLEIDMERNTSCRPDADVSRQGSKVPILVIHTQEEVAIARETLRLVAALSGE